MSMSDTKGLNEITTFVKTEFGSLSEIPSHVFGRALRTKVAPKMTQAGTYVWYLIIFASLGVAPQSDFQPHKQTKNVAARTDFFVRFMETFTPLGLVLTWSKCISAITTNLISPITQKLYPWFCGSITADSAIRSLIRAPQDKSFLVRIHQHRPVLLLGYVEFGPNHTRWVWQITIYNTPFGWMYFPHKFAVCGHQRLPGHMTASKGPEYVPLTNISPPEAESPFYNNIPSPFETLPDIIAYLQKACVIGKTHRVSAVYR